MRQLLDLFVPGSADQNGIDPTRKQNVIPQLYFVLCRRTVSRYSKPTINLPWMIIKLQNSVFSKSNTRLNSPLPHQFPPMRSYSSCNSTSLISGPKHYWWKRRYIKYQLLLLLLLSLFLQILAMTLPPTY